MDKDAGGDDVLRPAEVVVVNNVKVDPNDAGSEQGWAAAESGNTKLKGDLEDSSGTSPYGGNTAPLSSRVGAILNFVNSIVGAGVVGMPYALKRCGLFLGLILLLLVAFLTDRGVQMLTKSGAKVNRLTYEGLGQYCFGRAGFLGVSCSMFIFAFGAMLAYIVIIGDTVPKVAANLGIDLIDSRETVLIIVATCIILPITLLRNLSSLATASFISLSAEVILLCIVIVKAPSAAQEQGISPSTEEDPFVFGRGSFVAGLGAFAFAFVCHHSTFFVRDSLRNLTEERWAFVTHFSVSVSLFFSLLISLVGYLTFYSEVKGDILNNFPADDPVINAARLMLAMTMVLTYPMEMVVARHSLFSLLFGKTSGMTDHQHRILTICIWASVLLLGLVFTSLGPILELTGSVGASALGYILPALIYLKVEKELLRKRQKAEGKESESSTSCIMLPLRAYVIPAIMLALGFLGMGVGSVCVFLDCDA